ncbi:MAG: hypothetical protein V2A34_00275 [Lentisphaerota bacterium]
MTLPEIKACLPAPYYYAWGNNPLRQERKGQPCRVLIRGSMNSVLVEFADGFRMVTSRYAIKKIAVTAADIDMLREIKEDNTP